MAPPVRHFKCPFCGATMPPEEYRAGKPWKCSVCAQPLQFSGVHSYVIGLCVLGITITLLVLFGLRGWSLFLVTVIVWFAAMLLCVGPLDGIFPPRLEPYRPVFRGPGSPSEFLRIFPNESASHANRGLLPAHTELKFCGTRPD